METLLDIKNLSVSFDTYAGTVKAVRNVSFQVKEGETVAVVGESGCGKTVTAKSIMGLVKSPPGRVEDGSQILFEGKNIFDFTKEEWEKYRGEKCAIIFQDALAVLNPTIQVGKQIGEMLKLHTKMNAEQIKQEVIRLMESVGIPEAEQRCKQYPHEFSGGQRQRIMIAMALACTPKLLIADEPTTSLDVTVQAQILELLQQMKLKSGVAVLLITHNLGIVAKAADRLVVMYGGEVVEQGSSMDIFYRARHPYTWALINAVPRIDVKLEEELTTIEGTPPDLIQPPTGCVFHPRCPYCMEICRKRKPQVTADGEHISFCWLNHSMAPKVEIPIRQERE